MYFNGNKYITQGRHIRSGMAELTANGRSNISRSIERSSNRSDPRSVVPPVKFNRVPRCRNQHGHSEQTTSVFPCYITVYSSPPSAAYMRQWTGYVLVQVMACLLFGAKPLHETMLADSQLDTYEQTSVKFESKYHSFHSRICMCRLRNGGILFRGRWVI